MFCGNGSEQEMTLAEEMEFLQNFGSQRGDGEAWYIIDAEWLKRWKQFVTTGALWLHPGPITNNRLMDVSSDLSSLKPGLEAKRDYRALGKEAWEYLLHRYGGGPCIECATLDVYARHCTRIVKTWQNLPQKPRSGCTVRVKDSLDWVEQDGTNTPSPTNSVAFSSSPSTGAHEMKSETSRSSTRSRPEDDMRSRQSSKCSSPRSPSQDESRRGSKNSNSSKRSASKVARGVASALGFASPFASTGERDGEGSGKSKLGFPSFFRTFEV